MTKRPLQYLREKKPAPLASEESARLLERVESRLNFGMKGSTAPVAHTTPLFTIFRRPAFAFAAGLLLVLGSSATAYAANEAGPGDLLYPVDLAMERAHLAITPKAKQEGLRYRYALERVDELATHVDRLENTQKETRTTNSETGQTAIEELDSHLRYVEHYLDKEEQLSETQRNRIHQALSETSAKAERLRIHQTTETEKQTFEATETTTTVETTNETNDTEPLRLRMNAPENAVHQPEEQTVAEPEETTTENKPETEASGTTTNKQEGGGGAETQKQQQSGQSEETGGQQNKQGGKR